MGWSPQTLCDFEVYDFLECNIRDSRYQIIFTANIDSITPGLETSGRLLN